MANTLLMLSGGEPERQLVRLTHLLQSRLLSQVRSFDAERRCRLCVLKGAERRPSADT